MGVNMFVRKTFNANALKKEINKFLNPKIRAIRTDKQLANQVADVWASHVNNFVPRSKLSGRHLQDYTVSDGRVVWRRPARTDIEFLGISEGEDISSILYEGPIKGEFRSRYAGHDPHPHWDEYVTPGTDAWEDFVQDVTPIIIERVRNSG